VTENATAPADTNHAPVDLPAEPSPPMTVAAGVPGNEITTPSLIDAMNRRQPLDLKALGIDEAAEVAAGAVVLATGVPAKAQNQHARLIAAIERGEVDPELLQRAMAHLASQQQAQAAAQSAAASAPPPRPQVQQAPRPPAASLFQSPFQGTPAAAPAQSAPPVATPASDERPRVPSNRAEFMQQMKEVVHAGNQAATRPLGIDVPPEHRARRISLPLGEKNPLAPGEEFDFVVTVPDFANEVPFAELRKLQILPYGADRCLLTALFIDDFDLQRGGKMPGTMLTRGDGAPTGLVYGGCRVLARFRNISNTPIALSPHAQIVPLERARRAPDDGSPPAGQNGPAAGSSGGR
jgi:hypothetical protein